MSHISSHIDRLRNLRVQERPRPSLEQVSQVVVDIYNQQPLAVTLENPLVAPLGVQGVIEVAEGFGKFRARSHKGSAKAKSLLEEETGMLWAPTRAERDARAALLERGRRDPWRGNCAPELDEDVPAVIIPAGYDPATLGRNIRASLSALARALPDSDEIQRYWNRRYAETAAELTAEHVCLVWWLATNRLGHKLDELDASTEHLNGLLVRAHDLLETRRKDALRALRSLCVTGSHEAPAETLIEALDAVTWADMGLFRRVRAAVDQLNVHDTDAMRRTLSGRLNTVRSWAGPAATGVLADIAMLNQAHVALLCDSSGLATDAAEERRVREELRSFLVSVGLGADLDQEVPAGLAAWRMGQLEAFYTSRAARAESASQWALQA